MSLTFIWPAVLAALAVVPPLAAVYVRALRRPARHPIIFSTTGTLIASGTTQFRLRHLPAALLGVAVVLAVLAGSRPVMPLPVPADRAAIVLVLDISGSMRSMDIAPSRLAAAQAAAKAFLDAVPDRVRVGLVVFAGFAALLAPPTTDHARLAALIDGVSTARRTAIGEGLMEGVAALPGRHRAAPDWTPAPAPDGRLPPGFIVLLSDGRNNAGIDPVLAAEIAKQQQVVVYTVGAGQPVTSYNTWTIGGSLDEETLQGIATVTGGTYFHASSAQGLQNIYRRLARHLGWDRRPTEVSALAAGAAAAVMLAALTVSWLRVSRLGT